ncbi:hypothetical protein MUK70_15840 [Dyadobacter chenwenxiniae]|uniref:Uncharacterized protein n=1 Tax=Dyadobacter chenwenxiniae TaxID=2906456 RepID=A0A9X1PH86_9BACT|nr:hypothetical protein [Dyadobacter chenwenxiniae]MCF0060713.1 hypothetical protein [Dyadobacter chenwenxiniae]UON80547.1 hypothetical protein MUK70_15840 [Dyadobacter chenwenxiniae]
MFFIWDMIFGTAKVTREFSGHIGLEDYHEEPWYVQLGYPSLRTENQFIDGALKTSTTDYR